MSFLGNFWPFSVVLGWFWFWFNHPAVARNLVLVLVLVLGLHLGSVPVWFRPKSCRTRNAFPEQQSSSIVGVEAAAQAARSGRAKVVYHSLALAVHSTTFRSWESPLLQ